MFRIGSVLGILGALGLAFAPAVVAGPAPETAQEGPVKWADGGANKPFFIDVDGDLTFTAADAKFQIQGGTAEGPMIVGDYSGNTQDQIGIVSDEKVFIESGNFKWTPASDSGDTAIFFAPGVGVSTQAGTCDFKMDNADDFFKLNQENKIFVDAGGDRTFNTGDGDAKFNIQGSIAGIYFAGDFGSGCQIGVMTSTKVFLESGNYKWTPATDSGDVNSFFASGVGTVVGVVVGDFNPDRAGDEFAKLVDNAGVLTFFVDVSGDLKFDAADGDQKLRIQGGAVEGPGIAGVFNTDAGKAVLGQFSTTKVFVDFNGDYSWTPSSGDVANFFAPDVGAVLGAGSGAFAAPQ